MTRPLSAFGELAEFNQRPRVALSGSCPRRQPLPSKNKNRTFLQPPTFAISWLVLRTIFDSAQRRFRRRSGDQPYARTHRDSAPDWLSGGPFGRSGRLGVAGAFVERLFSRRIPESVTLAHGAENPRFLRVCAAAAWVTGCNLCHPVPRPASWTASAPVGLGMQARAARLAQGGQAVSCSRRVASQHA